MKYKNYWTNKVKERTLLKIAAWAQRNGKKVETLTQADIREAIRSYYRTK